MDDSSNTMLSAFDWRPQGGSAESCSICKSLLDAAHWIVTESLQRLEHHAFKYPLEWTVNKFVATIGSFPDIFTNSTCKEHQEFIQGTFDSHWFEGCGQDSIIEVWCNEHRHEAILYAHDAKRKEFAEQNFRILTDEPAQLNIPWLGRPMDKDFASVDVMKKWISTCDATHRLSCGTASPPTTPLSWMIDTWDHCLVPAVDAVRFVALSYVWGQIDMLKTETTNIRALQEAGALRKSTSLGLPQVIRHAIALVPQLGERYLWVDSLCIVQDDKECLDRHIRHMASIFGAATLTIVAGDGKDADYGLLGMNGVSKPRSTSTPTLSLTSRIGLRPRGNEHIYGTTWSKRGWTYQEYVFSRRKLMFIHGSVQWICQGCQCFEDTCHEYPPFRSIETRDIFPSAQSIADLTLGYPLISQLNRLIWEYTARDLTYENDILRGIEAIFNVHRDAFPDGFFQGLPLGFLDMALLWSHECKGLKRRSSFPHSSQSPFPSWSWAGWIGALQDNNWHDGTYIKDEKDATFSVQRKKFQTIPMLEWRYRPERGSPDSVVPGQNSAYAYKQKFMGKADGLPYGWKFERESSGLVIGHYEWRPHCEDRNRALPTPYYYSHEAAPGVKFWHPVPILCESANSTVIPVDGLFLCARTRSGSLWAIQAKPGIPAVDHVTIPNPRRPWEKFISLFNDMIAPDFVLLDEKGTTVVGDFYIDDEDDHKLVKECERRPDEVGHPCVLVAISKGNDFLYPMEPEEETYTFYNVLWIKWEDGVAYRRGVGRVKKETWESMELEDVDLVLG